MNEQPFLQESNRRGHRDYDHAWSPVGSKLTALKARYPHHVPAVSEVMP